MRRSIKSILLWSTMIVSALLFLAQMIFSIVDYQQNLQQEIERGMLLQARNDAAVLEAKINWISSAMISMSRVIESVSYSGLKRDQLLALQSRLLQDNDLVYGWGFWFEPYQYDSASKYFGPYVIRQGKGGKPELTWIYNTADYNYLDWEWYQKPLKSSQELEWSNPFYDPESGVTMITGGSAFRWQGKKVGVATADVDILAIETYLARIKVGSQGHALIIDGKGYFWGSKELQTQLNLNHNQKLKGLLLQARLAQLLPEVMINSQRYLVAVAPIKNTSMKMVILMPEQEVYATRNQVLLKTGITFGLSLFLWFLLLNLLVNHIINKPTQQLVSLVDKIKDGDLQAKSPSSSLGSRELDTLLYAVTNMQREIFQLINDINEKNQELSTNHQEIVSLYQQTAAMNQVSQELLEDKRHLLAELSSSYLSMVRALANAIEAKDTYTRGHCERVSNYAVAIGRIYKMSEDDLLILRVAGLLHDIGKINVPAYILNKNGPLDEEEYDLVKKHPEVGFQILRDVGFMETTRIVILQHHERIDGHGYPQGLKGLEIELMARILTVCDVYDAMTTSRPYRDVALSMEQAINDLLANAGSQVDLEVVQALMQTLHCDVPFSLDEPNE